MHRWDQKTKIMTFLPQSKFVIKKSELESNPILYPECLGGLAFLVILKLLNKQSFRVKSASKSGYHVSNSQTINKFTIFRVKGAVSSYINSFRERPIFAL